MTIFLMAIAFIAGVAIGMGITVLACAAGQDRRDDE